MLNIYQKHLMESHKGQAISSQFMFKWTLNGQECLDSYPSKVEASFQHLLHNSIHAVYASHNLSKSCPYDFSY